MDRKTLLLEDWQQKHEEFCEKLTEVENESRMSLACELLLNKRGRR
jgi:hypothetical protein